MKDCLKPCPFCGGEAEYLEEEILQGQYYYIDYVSIVCQTCGASTNKFCKTAKGNENYGKEKVTKRWNRRINN